ncbi:SpoIIE family protein phosphatase [Streptomyces sp. RS10V-4]|uniref:SpoIIE family protein phosphatase/ATP-binding protein n=1 Tax=Streptomyces rhizoryzae TaxID=2932493 RepID=UPI0020052948|nr:SpoIIE family protein phosphatase/ATP-binding protein [Streptomyces rhizoryzae]MCK7622844.1 SpoIIE family protein phosphatase [Streptomyces rhizoryzae]
MGSKRTRSPARDHRLPRPPGSRWWRGVVGVRSVAGQVFVLQWVMVLLLIAVGAAVLAWQNHSADVQAARDRSLASAVALAESPSTLAALRSPEPTATLQPVAVRVGRSSGVDFVAVLSPSGIRYTDTDPRLIGTRAAGDFSRALAGQSYTERFQGAPQAAVRAVVPVKGADGAVAGIVTTGVEFTTVSAILGRELPLIAAGAAVALALATAGAGWLSRRLSQQTHGLGPAEVTRMYEHHDAVLHAVREGVLVTGGDRRLVLANDEARRLLALPEDAEGRPVGELGLAPDLADLLTGRRVATDEVHRAGDRLLAVSHRPAGRPGQRAGSVATLRDTTELRAVAGRAEATAQRLQLLFDAGAQIGTTLDVVRTAEELAAAAVPGFADAASVDLLDFVVAGEDPPPAVPEATRRVAACSITAEHPQFAVGAQVPLVPDTPQRRSLEEDRAVLVSDLAAAEDWRAPSPGHAERAVRAGFDSLIVVPIRARGTVLGRANFWRCEDNPFHPDDLAFAEELVARAAVCLDNAHRYTREHVLAVSLQRSLLPGDLPEQNAVRVAHRYLPAQPGVGGDWFDVIPLPGARVALVVGDVVGHGVHAAATMGRLRTAVHNFTALDLPPDELLSYVDELVTRIDQDPPRGVQPGQITGATLLYLVYDPTTGRCRSASAGHVPPALVRPDGTADFLPVPANLPLGLGTSVFETHTVDLPPGSRLVLYTDGLVESRDRDLNTGLDLLCTVLGGARGGSEQTCDEILGALVPPRPTDDIALMVATTCRLDPSRVAQWDVEPDPSAVGPVRAACAEQLVRWGLGETVFTTELLLSELITNAIRYGAPPITVRLVCDRLLTCEVADASSTAPHLRKAAATDEGGRGLFLVAHLAQRWGTRYTSRGKIIWAEQALSDGTGRPPSDLADTLLDQADELGR